MVTYQTQVAGAPPPPAQCRRKKKLVKTSNYVEKSTLGNDNLFHSGTPKCVLHCFDVSTNTCLRPPAGYVVDPGHLGMSYHSGRLSM